MKIRIIIISLTVSTVIAGAIVFVLHFAPMPRYAIHKSASDIEITPARVAEGKRIALTICYRCHYNFETGTMAGRQHGNPKRLGDFYSGNITRDTATGIGSWSEGELLYFLRAGVKPDGEYVFDMPKYPHLSDEDIASIIAFLRSDDALVSPTHFENPKPKYSLLTKALAWTLLSPATFPKGKIAPPDTTDMIQFGKYLVAKFSCFECHSRNMVTNNYDEPEKSWGYMRGGSPHANEEREKIYSPDITGSKDTGIGNWSEEQFKNAVKNGIKPDGAPVRDPMFPFYLLSDTEVKAIYAYLFALEPASGKD